MKDDHVDGFPIDLHVHTKRYSECAELLDPASLPEVMRDLGLAGLVITEHDKLWTQQEIDLINTGLKRRKIYRGVEISTAKGHLVVIGIKDLDGLHPGIGIEKVLEKTRACGAAVILAHHHMAYPNTRYRFDMRTFPTGIDAIEVASSVTSGQRTQEALKIADDMKWKCVAGSDAHFLGNVGRAFTVFPELPEDEFQLSRAIRTGKGVPSWL